MNNEQNKNKDNINNQINEKQKDLNNKDNCPDKNNNMILNNGEVNFSKEKENNINNIDNKIDNKNLKLNNNKEDFINNKNQIKEYKKNKNNALNFKPNDNKGKIKYELLLKELKKKDEIIDNLKNEIEIINKKTEEEKTYINNEINNLKENKKFKINSLKSFFENEINLLKEEILKINNNKNDGKENKKNQIKKKDFDKMKDDLNDLNEKYSNFEKVFENKLEFIESSLSKLLQKEEKEKKEKISEDKKIIDNNNENNNNLNKHIIEDFFDVDWKDFKKKLDCIFSDKNNKEKEIKNDELTNLKDIALKYSKNHQEKLPVEQFKKYINEIISSKKPEDEDFITNIVIKKTQVMTMFCEIDIQKDLKLIKEKNEKNNSLIRSKTFQIGDNKKTKKELDVNAFRKEYGFSEKEFPDEMIKKEYIECKQNEYSLICKLTGIRF